jgi:transposase InsO family protein
VGPDKEAEILKIYDAGCTGLKRIAGELRKCKIVLAKSTIRRVLNRHGREPTDTNRRRGSTWAQFVARHAPQLVGIDFLQIPVGLLGRIGYRFVFFAIEHDTRKTHILGITEHPTGAWVTNAVRAVTMDGEPLAGRKYWIHDNDGKYGRQLRRVLKDRRLIAVRTSPYAPDMNAKAERWVRSIKEECLNHLVFLNDTMLRKSVAGYVRHYNEQRPHQGIGNVTIGPWIARDKGKIVCDQSAGGLLKSFRRAA